VTSPALLLAAARPPLGWAVPFAILLGCIAVLPVAAPAFWHRTRNQALVAFLCAAPVVVRTLGSSPSALLHAAEEYAAFVALLGALFTISGGIVVAGDLPATPRTNTAIFAVGVVLANVVGTTGAAMLLVRPLLRVNASRPGVARTVVFFIFTVCNTGGLLTPLADPPLFLGWLEGVPFAWTLRLWPWWVGVNAVLIGLHHVLDRAAWRREVAGRAPTPAPVPARARLRIEGLRNVVLLVGVVAAIASGLPTPWREAVLVVLAATSFLSTPKAVHEANGFSWAPILEVVVLFAGIFGTMIPAIELLRAQGPALGVSTPREFFLVTGGLSGLLDNAPTYLALLSVGQGLGLPADVVGVPAGVLVGISLGAVLMGANSYVGNGPNFMVKAIAERNGVKMPSFGGYLAWSGAVLVPLWLAVAFLTL
jgi:Na+/H+ antiporter NhaD/arsenite permease-like protein